jgi:rod shape determining protein RodA
MNFIANHFKKLDWKIIITVLLLCLVGLACIYSISFGKNNFSNFYKQITFLSAGVFLMLIFSFFDWRGLKDNPHFILTAYFICLILLLGLFFFAPQIRGIKGWYKFGSLSFDPIGITTVILIILLSKFFSRRHIEMYKVYHIILSGCYTVIPFILVARQPNLGSALILLAVWVGILIISGIKLKHFFLLLLCGILVGAMAWFFFLKDYQRNRVISFLNPHSETLGMNWSQTQSKIAIGSGGLFGQGFEKGSQTQNGFLSEPYTDFIFSALAEEFGVLGIVFVMILLLYLLWRIIKIAIFAGSNFSRLFASGLAIFIFFQAFINIGMNLGILPVIGLSMPFLSYGGSNLLSIFIGLGILQSIKAN